MKTIFFFEKALCSILVLLSIITFSKSVTIYQVYSNYIIIVILNVKKKYLFLSARKIAVNKTIKNNRVWIIQRVTRTKWIWFALSCLLVILATLSKETGNDKKTVLFFSNLLFFFFLLLN